MKAVISSETERCVICLREDGIIIEILKMFLNNSYKGQVIVLPDNKRNVMLN